MITVLHRPEVSAEARRTILLHQGPLESPYKAGPRQGKNGSIVLCRVAVGELQL